ncbi:MAG TPA: hypothetical protein VFB54_02790 [Burkholderiales bacterium]|nr:hypothetical protein [Burkholderiales bacterium]
MKALAACLALLLVSACAQISPRRPAEMPLSAEQACRARLEQTDRLIDRARVRDAEGARVEGFPYLRVDRFLASFSNEVSQAARFDAWRDRMRKFDHEARMFEFSNLDIEQRDRLAALWSAHPAPAALDEAVDRCAETLMKADGASSTQRDRLRKAAHVPDDYDTWKRVLGVYWLARLPFSAGVQRYQRSVQETFDEPLAELPVLGRLEEYMPRERANGPMNEDIVVDALGIPQPTEAQRDTLWATYAPIWIVDTADNNDRIGRVVLDARGGVRVDTQTPVAYRRLAYTRIGDKVLIQLVYSTWFASRPKTSRFDLLGGQLDSVVWRVTLSSDGTPLIFDSIHSCGCYAQFFPTPRARLRPRSARLEEGAFVPQSLPKLTSANRIGLRIASGTHYIERVLIDPPLDPNARTYLMVSDAQLRSLPVPGDDRRSAFRSDGIVAGSERAERYLFWPMGVRAPGAMRAWGRQATAFMGRRHFDEARLIERYFEVVP